ncbi:MAG: class I SAM-dependent methyltransferase [Chloroflexi bacterium]|nr:class I SAM-dependent methyltransferase [Anaerolineaceae bacterium]NMB87653.1 class I SAM-dependent methyltransferase [Chloroflexota bacterium]
MTRDAKTRFTSRVENYVLYRPGYPPAVLETLQQVCGLAPEHVVADIGSGTGILSRLLLENGNRVYGVEPNAAMRAESERQLLAYPGFTSLDGSAEDTGLPADSIDLVTAAQAFHWFDPGPTRQEFARILRPSGWVALVWNERQEATTPFLQAYEDLLLRFGTDYATVRHRHYSDEKLLAFFDAGASLYRFANQQSFDYAGLEGRLRSSSYSPEAEHPNFAPMLAELHRIFDAHQQDGRVDFLYNTVLYLGRLTG